LSDLRSPVAALVAALSALGCAGGAATLRPDLDALRAEVAALRQENAALARKVEVLSSRVDAVAARSARPPAEVPKAEAAAPPLVIPDLAVVRVSPPSKPVRSPPPLPIAAPIQEPDPERVEAISRRSGREIGAEAEAELEAARRKTGLDRARALETFAGRYPRHPGADNALVDAASAYAEAGRDDAACALARRAGDDYPAGDAVSEALEVLAACLSRRGAVEAERRLLERLVSEFPRTPAAERAEHRLAALSRAGPPADAPARSAP
jgi:TolA-binding protein